MLELFRAILEPPLVYVIAGGFVTLLVLLLVLARYLNRRYVVLRRSAGTDQIAFELARIAGALETIAARPRGGRTKAPLAMGAYRSGIDLSMFGR
jgi:hypothetical protein